MDYKVVLTTDAENDFDRLIQYLLFEKRNEQPAKNLLNDFELTKQNLERIAGSLRYCSNPKLKELGYKRINFISHRYFLLFRIDGKTAIVDNIFHELQDYENNFN